jgi:hypothetical protein
LKKKILSKEEIENKLTCPVCTEEFNDKEEDEIVEMPCGHIFHKKSCLLPWLERKNNCPVCRFE